MLLPLIAFLFSLARTELRQRNRTRRFQKNEDTSKFSCVIKSTEGHPHPQSQVLDIGGPRTPGVQGRRVLVDLRSKLFREPSCHQSREEEQLMPKLTPRLISRHRSSCPKLAMNSSWH
ncbi:hypothetical protein PoB_005109900 [Plakobranchus ocellatus]|uniref:Secreted protein n=1 Tax=Plakobranchus ocellatus TaxID=259542 RepID=A0AAV4C0E2_9GAST|nr:hypothetical protein PoB_005109900 [Plakobranchus ocellatus]